MERNTIAEMKAILDAIEQGKNVQYQSVNPNIQDEWRDYVGETPNFLAFRFRIKPEKKWRPFKDVDEFIKSAGGLGAIWLKRKDSNQIQSVVCLDYDDEDKPIRLSLGWEGFYALLEYYTFADGTTCGVEEQQ